MAELVEEVFVRLGAGSGDWTLTLRATDGHLRRWALEQVGGRDVLALQPVAGPCAADRAAHAAAHADHG